MPKPTKKRASPKSQPDVLKGWQQIAAFLGEPPSVVQRWASDGMPVRKQGRYVETTPGELNSWLGKGSGKPAPPWKCWPKISGPRSGTLCVCPISVLLCPRRGKYNSTEISTALSEFWLLPTTRSRVRLSASFNLHREGCEHEPATCFANKTRTRKSKLGKASLVAHHSDGIRDAG
jgi:hypothetical protein